MSPDFITSNIMPASSGDPVSVALQHSLNGSRKRLNVEDLDQKLAGSAKRALLTKIQYEETSYDTSILDDLKTKYTVLSAKVGVVDNSENKVKNGFKESHTEIKLPPMNKSDVLPKPKRVLYPPELIQLGWQGGVPVGAGLVNLGNTCYLNSTLQALFHVPAFVNWLLNDKVHSSKCEIMNGMTHTECLICAMKKTLQFAHHNTGSAIKPIQIYNKLKLICKHLVHGHQEDAHEFLRYLIESMVKSYLTIVQANNLDSYSKETTPLNQIFGGYIRTEVTCLECRHVSTTFSHFQDLLVDIRQASSIDDALDSYFGRERLGDGEEAYKCEQCHKRVAATKKFSIERPPKVLCVQLKRFGIMGGKNNKHISMTQSLDLTKYCHRDSIIGGLRYRYRLVSLVSHIGPSANCGHYTAVGQTSDGRYYQFDDSMVRFVSETSLSNTNAYIIMYEMEPPQPSQLANKITTSLPVSSNGLNGKSHQNGNGALQKSSPLRLPFFNKSFHSSPASQSPSTSSSSSLTPKRTKLTDNLSQNKSLVPYAANESSDSETDQSQPSTSKQNHVLPTNGVVKDSPKKNANLTLTPTKNGAVKTTTVPLKTNSNITTPLSIKTNSLCSSNLGNKNGIVTNCKSPVKDQSTVSINKWHITDVSANSPSGSSNHSATNNWNITETNSSKMNGENNEHQIEQASYKSSESRSNGTSRTWDGSRQSETVNHLLKLSHRGYGNNVTSWDGGRTQVDREAENERLMQRKRYHDQSYDEELDCGKVKKVKSNYGKNNIDRDRYGRRYNAFQDHQNRKNSWHNNRQQFYRQYSNHQYNKGHKNHHHNGYQNRNNYRWH